MIRSNQIIQIPKHLYIEKKTKFLLLKSLASQKLHDVSFSSYYPMPRFRISTNTKDHIPEEEEAKDILCLQVTQIELVGFFIFNHKITPSSTQKTAGLKIRNQQQNDMR